MMIHTKPTNDMMSFLKYKAEVTLLYKQVIKNTNGLSNIILEENSRGALSITFRYIKTKFHFRLYKHTGNYYFMFEVADKKTINWPNIFNAHDSINNLLYFKLGRVLYMDSKTWYHRV